jgi:ribosomal protein S27AE
VRLPLNKVYRAFPELDRFSDHECGRFVERANRDYPESRVVAGAIAVVISAAVIIALFILERMLWAVWSQRYPTPLARENAQDVVVVLSVLVYALLFCVGMLVARDRWLIRTITLRVHQTSCPSCGYSLLGLVVDKGVILCPECAAPFFLADHGMTEEDLLAPGPRGKPPLRSGGG